jgi:hypothetical protein
MRRTENSRSNGASTASKPAGSLNPKRTNHVLRKPDNLMSLSNYRTGLRHAETEIGDWPAETGAANTAIQGRKSRTSRAETQHASATSGRAQPRATR